MLPECPASILYMGGGWARMQCPVAECRRAYIVHICFEVLCSCVVRESLLSHKLVFLCVCTAKRDQYRSVVRYAIHHFVHRIHYQFCVFRVHVLSAHFGHAQPAHNQHKQHWCKPDDCVSCWSVSESRQWNAWRIGVFVREGQLATFCDSQRISRCGTSARYDTNHVAFAPIKWWYGQRQSEAQPERLNYSLGNWWSSEIVWVRLKCTTVWNAGLDRNVVDLVQIDILLLLKSANKKFYKLKKKERKKRRNPIISEKFQSPLMCVRN